MIFLCPNICAVRLSVKYVLESSFRYLTYEVLETDIKDFNILILVIIPIIILPCKLTQKLQTSKN